MRHLLVVLLTLIAFIGLGLGILIVVSGGSDRFAVFSFAFATPLILVGTVALAGVTIAAYVEAAAGTADKWQRELLASQLRAEALLKGLQMRAEAQLAETAKLGK